MKFKIKYTKRFEDIKITVQIQEETVTHSIQYFNDEKGKTYCYKIDTAKWYLIDVNTNKETCLGEEINSVFVPGTNQEIITIRHVKI